MYRWIRDTHLYLGLFISPFILVFAVSVWFLNHAKIEPAWTSVETLDGIQVPAGLDRTEGPEAVALARTLLPQLGLDGEVGFTRFVQRTGHFAFPVTKPGLEASVDVDTIGATAVVSRRTTGVFESLAAWHKLPGPHNVRIRGNWLGTRIWRVFADTTVFVTLFLTVSGLYLWFALKAERVVGLLLITAGALSLGGVMYAIVR